MVFLERLKPLGLLLLRVAVGSIFILHGYPILKDPAHWTRVFTELGLPVQFVYVSGILEMFGGMMLVVGLLTRGVGLLLAIEVAVVLLRSRIPGSLHTFGQHELPVMLGTAALALATTGAGLVSVDAFTFESRQKNPKKSKSKN